MAKKFDVVAKKSHKGLKTFATLSMAAGLAGAALLYLKKKGVPPKQGVTAAKKGAKGAATILSGESKAAYHEVRQAIVAELAKSNKKVTKSMVLATTAAVLAVLKRHGALSGQEFTELASHMKTDWNAMLAAAKTAQQK